MRKVIMGKVISIIVMAAIVLMATMSSYVSVVAASDVNLALNKTVTSSGGIMPNEGAEKVVDGKTDTKWCARHDERVEGNNTASDYRGDVTGAWTGNNNADWPANQSIWEARELLWEQDGGHWVIIDLGEIKTVGRYIIRQSGEGLNYNLVNYKIQVSTDGTTWTTVAEENDRNEGDDYSKLVIEKNINPVSAKYFRFSSDVPMTPNANKNRTIRLVGLEIYSNHSLEGREAIEYNLTDISTGIEIEATIMPPLNASADLKLRVDPLITGDAFDAVENYGDFEGDKFTLYDIYFMSDNTRFNIGLDDIIIYTIPIPEGYDPDLTQLFFILPTNDGFDIIDLMDLAFIEDGNIILEFNANGMFAIVEYQDKGTEELGETCTVVFDSDGGSDVEEQIVEIGEKLTKPADPSKEGYEFKGWYLGEQEWDFDSDFVEEDMILVALWEAIIPQTDPDQPDTGDVGIALQVILAGVATYGGYKLKKKK